MAADEPAVLYPAEATPEDRVRVLERLQNLVASGAATAVLEFCVKVVSETYDYEYVRSKVFGRLLRDLKKGIEVPGQSTRVGIEFEPVSANHLYTRSGLTGVVKAKVVREVVQELNKWLKIEVDDGRWRKTTHISVVCYLSAPCL